MAMADRVRQAAVSGLTPSARPRVSDPRASGLREDGPNPYPTELGEWFA